MSGEITAEFRHHVSAEYSFPFPPAHELARLNEVVPGGAERVMTLVEEEAKHRRTLEKKQLEAQIADLAAERVERWWGQVFGFGIGIVAIVGGWSPRVWGIRPPGASSGAPGSQVSYLFSFWGEC